MVVTIRDISNYYIGVLCHYYRVGVLSKLLVSQLISPIVVPCITPYTTPFKEFKPSTLYNNPLYNPL